MAKQSGLGDRLLVSGVNLSGDVGSLQRIGGGMSPLEVTGIDKSAFERIGGKRDGSIDFTAWFNDAAGASHATLKPQAGADVVVTYLRGVGIGSPAASLMAKQLNYDPTRAEDGGLTFGVQAAANGFGLEWGEQLTAGVRTDTAATNGTALDFGAVSTAFGLQTYLHVLAVTGTSVTVKLQDSADNVSFADIAGAAFTAVTPAGAPSAQRVAVTGTVRRYVRAVTTGTFSNAQFVVQLVRNLTQVDF